MLAFHLLAPENLQIRHPEETPLILMGTPFLQVHDDTKQSTFLVSVPKKRDHQSHRERH